MTETKTCTRCHTTKPFDQFPWCKDPRLSAGGRVGSQCKTCLNERAKAWQRDNYDRAFSNQKRWREENREQFNARMSEASKRYVAARTNNTPTWADAAKVAEVYATAAALRSEGHDVEVDHIVPLQGKLASGLHVHWNLQIVPRKTNRRKRASVNHDAYAVPNAWDTYCALA